MTPSMIGHIDSRNLMRTIDYSTIMFRTATLCGLDRSAITSSTFATLRDLANHRLAMIWESEAWPQLVRVSDDPGETVSEASDGTRTVTLASTVGDLFDVYNQSPRVTTRARPIKYFLYDNGTTRYINVMESVDSGVFLEWRDQKPQLFGDSWDNTLAYEVGTQIYFDTSTNTGSFTPSANAVGGGNFYDCAVATSAGQSPYTSASSWTKVDIPYFTGEYITRGVLADYLRSEGQYEQASAAEADAEGVRSQEVDKVVRQEGQVRRMNVYTY